MRKRQLIAAAASLLVAAGAPGPATADRPQPDPNVAGLQTALATRGFYRGAIDGLRGPQTRAAVRALQRTLRLVSNEKGVGRRTLLALGRLGRPTYGTRVLRTGMTGL